MSKGEGCCNCVRMRLYKSERRGHSADTGKAGR